MTHHVGGYHAGGPRLAAHRVDEDALVLVHGVLDEVIYFVGGLVGTIEEYLILLVEPGVGEVLHANVGPLVLHLPATTVDDPGHLVGHHELQVLGCE